MSGIDLTSPFAVELYGIPDPLKGVVKGTSSLPVTTSGLLSGNVDLRTIPAQATSSTITRLSGDRASDAANVRDYGATGNGTLNTISSVLGINTLAALAAYVPAAPAYPATALYSFVTNPLAGLQFTMPASAASGSQITFLDSLTGINNWAATCARWLNPAFGYCLMSVGMVVSGSTAIPAGTTVTAINSDPTSANYGVITLSNALTGTIAAGAAITFTLPDAAVAALSMDWLGIQAAMFAAQGANNYRGVYIPGGNYQINHTILVPSQITDTTVLIGGMRVFGDGGNGITRLVCPADLGRGHAIIKEATRVGNLSSFLAVSDIQFRVNGGSNILGQFPNQMNCLAVGAKATVRDCNIQGGRAGIAMVNDHQTISRVRATNNGYNLMYDDFSNVLGDQLVEGCDFTGGLVASIGIGALNQADSGTWSRNHTGFSPYSVFKEPAAANVTTSLLWITNMTIMHLAVESVGVGGFYGSGANSVIVNNRFISGGCGSTKYNSSYRPSGATPTAMVVAQTVNACSFYGFDFDPVGSGFPAFSFLNKGYQNRFQNCPNIVNNVSAAIPAFLGNIDYGLSFDYSIGRGVWLYAGSPQTQGMPASKNENCNAQAFTAGRNYAGVFGVTSTVSIVNGQPVGQAVPVWQEHAALTVVKAVPSQVISGGPSLFPTAQGFVAGIDGIFSVGSAVSGSPSGTTVVNISMGPNCNTSNSTVATGLNAGATVTLNAAMNLFSTGGASAVTLPAYAPAGYVIIVQNNTTTAISNVVSSGTLIVAGATSANDNIAANSTARYVAGQTLGQWIRA